MKRIFGFLLLVTALCSCATTKAIGTVAKTCEPSTDQMTKLVDSLTSSTDAVIAVASADALGFAVCMLQRGADEIVASLEPKPGTATLALTAEGYSPLLDNAKALRKAHP